MKRILIVILLLGLAIPCSCREIKIYLNADIGNIDAIDPDISYDTTRYEYGTPGDVYLYLISKSDTTLFFVAPCVSEYNISDGVCELFLWPEEVDCPDQCVCLMEDDTVGCHPITDDATLKFDITYEIGTFSFKITKHNDIGEIIHNSETSLKYAKEECTTNYWIDFYETIIHNLSVFSELPNQTTDVSLLRKYSTRFRLFKYGQ